MHHPTVYSYDFRAIGYPLRLYCGRDALEQLPAELKRHRSRRAFIICGRSVSRKTGLIRRIERIIANGCTGIYDEMEKDSPLHSVQAATAAARTAQADLLIAVGAGSVIQATRVVAILLAETRPVEELITQYPEDGPAISPRLLEPKLPIINVVTAATTAQNRAGSAVKNDQLDHRMEFFDPKTRPVALFWDTDAILTAPPGLARTTGASVFWRALFNLGSMSMTPLVEGDRKQAFHLARNALPRMGDMSDAAARIDMCAAAFLQNRDADDGGTLFEREWAGRVIYAFAAALINLHEHVGQGEANTALSAAVVRRFGPRDPGAMVNMARALGIWHEEDLIDDAPLRVAASMEEIFAQIGMPVRVSQLDIPRASLSVIVERSLKNFNADPRREFRKERDLLLATIESAW